MANYIGKGLGNIGNPRLAELFLVTPGFLQSGNGASNYEAMQLLFHGQKGALTAEVDAYAGVDESQLAYGNKITLNYPLWSSDLLVFSNVLRLSADRVNFFAKTENGEFLNGVPVSNGDYVGSPDGFTDITLDGTKWSNNEKERKFDLMGHGYAFDAGIQWLNSNKSAYVTTGSQVTGGTSLSLAQITNSRQARVLPHGFHTVLRGTHDVGDLESCSLEFEIVGGDLQYNQKVCRQLRYTATFKTKVANLANIAGGSTDDVTDRDLVMKSFAGEVFTFHGARGKVKKVMAANDWGSLEGSFTGLISYNSDRTATGWSTPDRIDFTNVNQPVFTCTGV